MVFRDEPLETLLKCIHAVHRGQVWAISEHLGYLIEALAWMKPMNLQDVRGANLLSKREETVARLVAEGLTTREISNELRLSEHTVRDYLLGDFRQTAGVVTRGIGALSLAGSAFWNGRVRQLTLKPGTPV